MRIYTRNLILCTIIGMFFKRFRIFLLRRFKQVKDRFDTFMTIPAVYRKIVSKKIHGKSSWRILSDLLTLFFKYKLSPDCYYLCRLWEVDRSDWKYYYGSNYRQPQKSKMQELLQPSRYSILFSDKYICQKLCMAIGVPTPKTFGVIYPDQDYREIILKIFQESQGERFFLKPLIGGGGKGISIAEREGENILIRTTDKIIQLREFIIKSPIIVQEGICQESRLAKLSSQSVNTIRVVTIYTKNHLAEVVAAFLRCGVGRSYVDNWSSGGIAIGVNIEKGQLMKYGFDKNANLWDKHPTSGIVFNGFQIPSWNKIIEIAKKVQLSFPCFRILGLDIAVDKEGQPIIIEVNDYPDLMVQEQTSGPLLKNESNLLEFGRYELLVNNYQKQLYNSLIRKADKGIL